MPAISFQQFTKQYKKSGQGVFDLTFDVEEGEWFGFIGENGSGKSTTIRTALGLMSPTSGTVQLLGSDTAGAVGCDVRARVGYVPSEPGLWDGMTVGETLAYLGSLHAEDTRARRRELLDVLELDPARDASDLSLGNKKKVAIVAAMQHRPPLLILDEPTNGLDPLMQQRLFELLKTEQQAGATVFFSSHILGEVERVCSRVAILKAGRLVKISTVEALKENSVRRVQFTRENAAAASVLALDGVENVVVDGAHGTFHFHGALPALLRALAADDVSDVRIDKPSLEEIVLEHYGRATTAARA
jgi:ABC-2 type transport system ATP-binding protein